MRLLLIRHPKPAVPEGTCYGRTDVAPDEAHLESMLERLRARWSSGAHATPLAVFSSPLQRCARVAQALAGELWPQPRFDERLAEMHFGDWEGRMWAQIPREQLDAWRTMLDDAFARPTASRRSPEGKRIKALEREVARKDKALAETAALLVLQKKLHLLLPAQVDEDDDTDDGSDR